MTNPTFRTKAGFLKFLIATLINGITVLHVFSPALAHAPHDVINSLAISPTFASDRTVFSVVRGSLLKSFNGGVTWKRLVQGIDSSYGVQSVVMDPIFPNIIYLSTLTAGIYKSEDTGESWHKINSGLSQPRISKIYIPPTSGNSVVFALDKRGWLYKTLDGGNVWSKIYVHPVPITEITGDLSGMLVGDANGGLFQSTDGGFVWGKLFEDVSCGAINAIAGNGNFLTNQTFFVGTEKCGIFRTVDAGKSFQKSNINIEDINIRSIALSPDFANDGTVLVSTWSKAAFVSTDTGLVWHKYDRGITTTSQAKIAGLPDFMDIRVSPDFKNDKTVFLGGFNGLFKSFNRGGNWQEMITMPGSLIQSFAISPSYNLDATIAVNTYLAGVAKSTDNGANWKNVLTNANFRGYDLAFSPAYATDQTLFASINPNIIAKSTDRGESWVNYTAHGVGPSIITISPTFFIDQTLFVATRFGIVNKSINGGVSYATVYEAAAAPDCGDTCLTSLTVSPNYSVDQTLLLAIRSRGVHISRDGGGTWELKAPKQAIGLQIKLAFSPNYATDRTIFFGGTHGLFKTADDFATWQKISDKVLAANDYIEELAVSPDFNNDKTMFVSVRGKGLLKSQDSGSTFQLYGLNAIKYNNLFTIWPGFPIPSLSAIRFSPKYASDGIIFANSSERLFRSQDRGKTWGLVVGNIKLP